MNFKTRSSNITKVLYIVLILCIVSIMFLSIYSIFNQSENQDNQDNLHNLNLNSDSGYEDSEDAILDIFRKKETTEAPTEAITQKPANTPAIPEKDNNIIAPIPPAEEPEAQESFPPTTDRTAELIIDPAEDAIEVLSVPPVYIKPIPGSISRRHNPDTPEYSVAMNDYRTHMGIDIDSDVGVNVKAVSDGVISNIYDDPLMGKTVVIDHPGNIQSVYMNLQESLPKNIVIGAEVKGGDVIGGIGESSLIEITDVPHLHFEMKKDGMYIDPLEYIKY